MKLIKEEKGISLVELIIAISILMIVIAAFTMLFTTSFSGIFTAGRKSESLFKAQEDIDNAMTGELNFGYDDYMEIKFDFSTVSVQGEEITVNYEYEERTGELKYFLPK